MPLTILSKKTSSIKTVYYSTEQRGAGPLSCWAIWHGPIGRSLALSAPGTNYIQQHLCIEALIQ